MTQVLLYTEPGNSGTQAALDTLAGLQAELPHDLVQIDVSQDVALRTQFAQRQLPVLEIGPYQLESPFSAVDLKVALGAARNSVSTSAQRSPGQWGLQLNRGMHFVVRHWLAVLSVVVALYAGLPFAAPALMKVGATGPARVLYTLYSPFCHQLAFRSWFLFGDQPAYPRQLAGTSLDAFGEVSGIDESDFFAARAFLGNEQLGYKVALCERDVAIYGGILVAGLVFGLLRDRLRPLPLKFWVLIGIVPIGLDGFSQLISQLDLLPLAARESTPLLRTLTGALFGLANVWMAYPHLEATMRETEQTVAAKLAVARQRSTQRSAD